MGASVSMANEDVARGGVYDEQGNRTDSGAIMAQQIKTVTGSADAPAGDVEKGGTSGCCLASCNQTDLSMEKDTTKTCLDGNLCSDHHPEMSKADREIFKWWMLFTAEIIFCGITQGIFGSLYIESSMFPTNGTISKTTLGVDHEVTEYQNISKAEEGYWWGWFGVGVVNIVILWYLQHKLVCIAPEMNGKDVYVAPPDGETSEAKEEREKKEGKNEFKEAGCCCGPDEEDRVKLAREIYPLQAMTYCRCLVCGSKFTYFIMGCATLINGAALCYGFIGPTEKGMAFLTSAGFGVAAPASSLLFMNLYNTWPRTPIHYIAKCLGGRCCNCECWRKCCCGGKCYHFCGLLDPKAKKNCCNKLCGCCGGCCCSRCESYYDPVAGQVETPMGEAPHA